ncbi:cadherin-99C-like isoform X2 [Stylophora pistillata]|uniref:cadherin-99C-like isoform X2 n=1 Tax=Stylophora pistillata TaxID=50429 RepID=UPI000C038C4C|nr:cadherin-99C-like isoform X2 [Stylophora pistillata]
MYFKNRFTNKLNCARPADFQRKVFSHSSFVHRITFKNVFVQFQIPLCDLVISFTVEISFISFLIPLSVTCGLVFLLFQSNVSFAVLTCNSSDLFAVDHLGILRTVRNLVEDDATYHILEISVSAKDSTGSQLVELALVTVDLSGCLDPPLFEDPFFTFSVDEGESGLTVGFIKAVNRHTGLSENISCYLKNEQIKYLFEVNQTSGEIKTARALDRETADFHLFIVEANLHFLNGSYKSLAEASDKDIGQNAEVAFEDNRWK